MTQNSKPLLSGFTFIKNGLTLGYPIKESIESIAPICDEVIINVGFNDIELTSDDGTYAYLKESFPDELKYKFLKSYWDPELTKSGLILSEQTNIALKECQGKYCQYIQGDEVVHEDDLEIIQQDIKKLEENSSLQGLVFNYIHFYGNVDIIKFTRNIYRREVRLIRNNQGSKSWLDAQGFKTHDNQKLKCTRTKARIFHYGWARKENVMREKVKTMDKLYHGAEFEAQKFKYEKIWGLKAFVGSHPKYVKKWVEQNRNDIDILSLPLRFEFKNIGLMISDIIERWTGYRLGEYKNYRLDR